VVSEMDDGMRKLFEAQQQAIKALSQGLLGCMNDLLGKAASPEAILGFLVAMGLDTSGNPKVPSQVGGNDPYKVLGLKSTATEEEVRTRYRKLMFILHPDTAASEGTEYSCQQVTEAYQKIAKERGF